MIISLRTMRRGVALRHSGNPVRLEEVAGGLFSAAAVAYSAGAFVRLAHKDKDKDKDTACCGKSHRRGGCADQGGR